MGCCAEPAAVHIAHVLQRLHFFQFFTRPYRKKRFNFFLIIHTTYRKKKITRLDDFLHTHTPYIFHPTCGPLLLLSPAVKCLGPAGDFPNGGGYVANLPFCGILLIFSPSLKLYDLLQKQNLHDLMIFLYTTCIFTT